MTVWSLTRHTLWQGQGRRSMALALALASTALLKWVDCGLETQHELTKIANSMTAEPFAYWGRQTVLQRYCTAGRMHRRGEGKNHRTKLENLKVKS